jgi:hypothetical protein
VLVVICADFFHASLFAGQTPDIVAVPAFSVTRLADPRPARTVWRHMAAARSYELGAYVAISDWSRGARQAEADSSAVAGLAQPFPSQRGSYFAAVGGRQIAAFELDFRALDAVHDDRRQLGFLARSLEPATTAVSA